MVEQIDTTRNTDGVFSAVQKAQWKALNSFTHSGLLQITSRFRGTTLTPDYDEQGLVQAVEGAFISTALLMTLVLRMHGRYEDADKVDALLREMKGAAEKPVD
jgi:hypothetical protein